MGVLLEPLHASYASGSRTALLMLSGAVGLLFLIVCANLASLQLGRGVGRTRELAIRRALGDGRARVLRHCSLNRSCSRSPEAHSVSRWRRSPESR